MRRRHVAVLALALAGAGPAYDIAAADDRRWTPRERADLLEPWSLEPGAAGPPSPRPLDPARPGAAPGEPRIDGGVDAGAPGSPSLPTGQGVEVVRCRQITLGQPARADRLAAFLRSGSDLETARRAVGGVEVTERTRDYALADLEPDIRDEIATLPVGGWSRVRTTRGRATLFQLVSRDRRDAASLPALGSGLGAEETARLQRLQRPRPPVPVVHDETGDTEAAVVVQQVPPEYPSGATTSGQVTVRVRIGRADDVVDVSLENSTDPVFEAAALYAARRSTYRAARRDGIPESSEVVVTFNFVAPQQQPQPQPND
jgi:TonB family protein